MSGLDRRAALGAAGAGLLVAACSRTDEPGAKASTNKDDANMTGIFPTYGNPVTDKQPDPLAADVSFEPKHVCVIYLKMEPNGEFTARHGYEPYPGAAGERALVESMLKQASNGPGWKHVQGEKNRRREHNFDSFSQNSQQRIWLFVDNDPSAMAFEDRNGDEYVIRFAPMSGVDPVNKLPQNNGRKHYPNNAFFNIDVIDGVSIPGLKGSKLISLDYWDTDADGKRIATPDASDIATHYLFAINIHLKLAMSKKAGPNQWLPMIVDPDGGNMGGAP